MRSIILLYLQVFLLTGILFTIIFSLIWGDRFDIGVLLTSALMGVFCSLLIVTMHLFSLKSRGVETINSQNLKVVQRSIITSKLSEEELITLLKNHPYFREMEFSRRMDKILLHSGTSIRSWGEVIVIERSAVQENVVMIESRPKFRFTIVDFGQNMANIQRLEQVLSIPE